MQKQGLFVLTGVTLVAVVAAGWAVRQRSSSASGPAAAGGKVFAELSARADDVAQISVTDGKDTVTVKREGEDWKIVERAGFPAKLEKVRDTVLGVAQLEIEEPKTKKKEQYAALGVEEPAGETTTSKRVVLQDAGGATLAGAVLSEPKWRGGSQIVYARRDGDDQVYQCESKLALDATAKGWMETELLKLAQDRVQSVTIVHKDGEEVRIGRSPENHTQFTVENLPPEGELASPAAASSIGTALSYLTFEDVRPASEIDWNADPRARTRFRSHDGLEIDIESARVDEKTWIRLEARYEEPVGPAPSAETPPVEEGAAPAAEETPAEGTPPVADPAAVAEGESDAPDPEKIKQEVVDLNAKFAGWAFEIQDYRADALAKRMEDLLKKPAEATEGDAEAPGAEGELPPELREMLENAGGGANEPVPEDDGGDGGG
jgi:hypothetical protein